MLRLHFPGQWGVRQCPRGDSTLCYESVLSLCSPTRAFHLRFVWVFSSLCKYVCSLCFLCAIWLNPVDPRLLTSEGLLWSPCSLWCRLIWAVLIGPEPKRLPLLPAMGFIPRALLWGSGCLVSSLELVKDLPHCGPGAETSWIWNQRLCTDPASALTTTPWTSGSVHKLCPHPGSSFLHLFTYFVHSSQLAYIIRHPLCQPQGPYIFRELSVVDGLFDVFYSAV